MQRRSIEAARPAARRQVALGDGEARFELNLEDLCRHTLVVGSSGAGKTTRAFNPLLAQMLGELDAGALIVAPKVQAAVEAVEIARRAGREALLVEPGSEIGLELLSGSPDIDAMYLRDALGRLDAADEQYLDAAVARLRNVLRMLEAAGNHHYTLEHLALYCFDERYAALVRVHAAERLRGLPAGSDQAWTIEEAIKYEDSRYFQFTPETRRSIQFALSQLLEPLRDAKIIKTFARKRNLVSLESLFDGGIIVLHVPRTEYAQAAQVLYTIAKRRFFGALERRRANPALDQQRPIVLAIDEYQLCISASDILSLGIVRSAGCMVLATAHGVSSLYSVLAPRLVDAALQNFTQKIFFKTDDHETLALLERLIRHSGAAADASRLFAMNRDQALCHLTVGDRSIDDVLTLSPLFVAPDYFNESTGSGIKLETVA